MSGRSQRVRRASAPGRPGMRVVGSPNSAGTAGGAGLRCFLTCLAGADPVAARGLATLARRAAQSGNLGHRMCRAWSRGEALFGEV